MRGAVDSAALGDAMHGFIAADVEGLSADERSAMARGLLARWGVEAITVDDLVRVTTAFRSWVKDRHGDAVWHREVPVYHRLASGTVAHGIIDLLLETPDGCVVVDHKSALSPDVSQVLEFAPQVRVYVEALRAAGKLVVGAYVHAPFGGWIAQVG